MSDRNPMDPKDLKGTAGPAARALPCEEWEAMLVDALDGTLPTADSAAFQGHTSSCTACMELLTRSKQGQEWLKFLVQPPVSPDLVAKILSKTSGVVPNGLVPATVVPQASRMPMWMKLPVPLRRMAEPRLMMTTAMAFFSIALTLNLAGVRLTAVHAADLRPSLLRTNLTRQFINSKVGVENYCYNLRIVYEMEARVRELKRSSDAEIAPRALPQQAPQAAPSGTPAVGPRGSAHKGGGKSENPHNPEPRAALWGQSLEASLPTEPAGVTAASQPLELSGVEPGVVPGVEPGISPQSYVRPETDRAEGSLA